MMKNKLLKIFLGTILFILMLGLATAVECGSTPTSGCDITQDTTFATGTYYITDNIVISVDNIIIDGNNSLLIGKENSSDDYVIFNSGQNVTNITLRNINVTGISEGGQGATVFNTDIPSWWWNNIVLDNFNIQVESHQELSFNGLELKNSRWDMPNMAIFMFDAIGVYEFHDNYFDVDEIWGSDRTGTDYDRTPDEFTVKFYNNYYTHTGDNNNQISLNDVSDVEFYNNTFNTTAITTGRPGDESDTEIYNWTVRNNAWVGDGEMSINFADTPATKNGSLIRIHNNTAVGQLIGIANMTDVIIRDNVMNLGNDSNNWFVNVQGMIIENNTFTQIENSIFNFLDSSDVLVNDNTLEGTIDVDNSNNMTFTDNTLEGTIDVDNSNNMTFTDNTMTEGNINFHSGTNDIYFYNNDVTGSDSTFSTLVLNGASDILVENNNFTRNSPLDTRGFIIFDDEPVGSANIELKDNRFSNHIAENSYEVHSWQTPINNITIHGNVFGDGWVKIHSTNTNVSLYNNSIFMLELENENVDICNGGVGNTYENSIYYTSVDTNYSLDSQCNPIVVPDGIILRTTSAEGIVNLNAQGVEVQGTGDVGINVTGQNSSIGVVNSTIENVILSGYDKSIEFNEYTDNNTFTNSTVEDPYYDYGTDNQFLTLDVPTPVFSGISPTDFRSLPQDFTYTITTVAEIDYCNLYFDGNIEEAELSFGVNDKVNPFSYGISSIPSVMYEEHNWNILCYDVFGNSVDTGSMQFRLSEVGIHESNDISGLVVDTVVEGGRTIVSFAGLIAMFGVGTWLLFLI